MIYTSVIAAQGGGKVLSRNSHGRLRGLVQSVFDKLPLMVGRKFSNVKVSRDHRAAELARALDQPCGAGKV